MKEVVVRKYHKIENTQTAINRWRNTPVSRRYESYYDNTNIWDYNTNPVVNTMFRRPILTKNFGTGSGTRRGENDYNVIPRFLYEYTTDSNEVKNKLVLEDNSIRTDYQNANNTKPYYNISSGTSKVPGRNLGTITNSYFEYYYGTNDPVYMNWYKFTRMSFKGRFNNLDITNLNKVYSNNLDRTPYYNYGEIFFRQEMLHPNHTSPEEVFTCQFIILPDAKNYEYFIYEDVIELVPEDFKVTFKYNNGNSDTVQTIKENNTVNQPTNPTRINHTFNGWYLNGSPYNFTTPVTKNIILEAQWIANEPDKYTVTFQFKNNINADSTVQVEEGTRVTAPATPFKQGHTFDGWYLNGDLFNFNEVINSDIVLVAMWTENPPETKKVTFEFNNGTNNLVQEIVVGEKTTKPSPDPTKEDHTFGGWLLNGLLFNFNTPIQNDLILVARWDIIIPDPEPDPEPEIVNVIYVFNNGNANITVQIEEGETLIKPNNPIRDGYEFNGWMLNGTLFDFNIPILTNIILVADWSFIQDETIHVTFRANNGTVDEVVGIIKGSPVPMPPNPIRNNYTFKGWVLNGILFDFNRPILTNIMLVADWQEDTEEQVQITFKFLNGDSDLISIIRKDRRVTEPEKPVKENYIFEHWEYDGVKFNFDNRINNNMVLVAKWGTEEFLTIKKGILQLDNKMEIFQESTLGIQVRLFIAPAKNPNDHEWDKDTIKKMEAEAEVLTSAYMPYQSEEIKLPSLYNTSKILESRYMTFFEDMLVLYGGTTHGNIIYLSDFQSINYFPFKYALDQIPDEIVHIHSFRGVMVVFTKSDIWAIEKVEFETESGAITTDFYSKKILQNIFIDAHLKSTIRTVGKHIMVMLEDRIIFLKPNSFTGDNTDLSYVEVSAPIGNIIKDPSVFVKQRLTMYNIFTEEDLKFDLDTEVDNRDFKIILSTFLEKEQTPYMLEVIYDGTRGIWTLNDTLSTAYPIYFNKGSKYFKSHPSLPGGIVLSEDSGINKYNMLDPKKAHVDIHNFVYYPGTIVTRPDGFLVKPINTLVDLGYMNISNQLTKRFQEARMELTNINTNVINMGYDFRIDNKQQQTTYEVVMRVKDGVLIEDQYFDLNTEILEEASITSFENFRLDLSKFPTANKLDLRIPINGRGRVPRLMMSMEITNDFEIFRFLIIYKEQTGRMASQR